MFELTRFLLEQAGETFLGLGKILPTQSQDKSSTIYMVTLHPALVRK
jgi:hypothetical protein